MKKKIYFSNVTIETHLRGNKWNLPQKIEGVVVSGADEEIKKDEIMLRRLAIEMLGKKKGSKFDLGKIRIISIEKIKPLGLGYMHQVKNYQFK